ncbi:MAG TPA: hypothetical protein VEN29_02925 [Casimicrobiaceae bacterium]|nr:hypothetical protein [Casimicrobiaceae bacterium]
MAHRVNVLLEDAVWATLSKAPQGERSHIVNNALKQWFHRRSRRDAARRMDELRALLPPISAKQIVAWVREERERAG